MKKKIIAFYLEWFNHWVTVESFAEHNGLTVLETIRLIDAGRKYHDERIAINKLTTKKR